MIKKLSTLLLLLLVTTFLTNCTKSATNPVSVKFRKKNFTKTYDSTAANAENYVHIKIDYIEFTEAATSVAKDSLNKIVEDYISASIFEQKTKTLEQLAESLINDYKKQKREFPDFPGGYELERSVEVLYSNDKLVCVKFNEYSYFGGAHPNSVMFYTNVDLQTGKTIKLKELFVDGYKDELNKIAEKYFRKERELKPDEDLEQAGFWFKENVFSINENFAIAETGLDFFFNDYEVTSHAAGPTLIEIPYSELKSIIKPSGFISNK